CQRGYGTSTQAHHVATTPCPVSYSAMACRAFLLLHLAISTCRAQSKCGAHREGHCIGLRYDPTHASRAYSNFPRKFTRPTLAYFVFKIHLTERRTRTRPFSP